MFLLKLYSHARKSCWCVYFCLAPVFECFVVLQPSSIHTWYLLISILEDLSCQYISVCTWTLVSWTTDRFICHWSWILLAHVLILNAHSRQHQPRQSNCHQSVHPRDQQNGKHRLVLLRDPRYFTIPGCDSTSFDSCMVTPERISWLVNCCVGLHIL